MGIKGIGGKVGRLPVYGGYVTLDSADVGQITRAAAGITKTLVAGGVAVALASIFVAPFANQRRYVRQSRIPLTKSLLLYTDSEGRFLFYGFCLDEWVDLKLRGERLRLPLDRVWKIYGSSAGETKYQAIYLIDGSEFEVQTRRRPS